MENAPEEEVLAPDDHADAYDENPMDELVVQVRQALQEDDQVQVRELLEPFHAADQAELLNILPSEDRQSVTSILAHDFDHEILPELEPEAADDVFEALGLDRSAEALAYLETDDAVHVIGEMTEANQQEMLEAIPAAARGELEESLAFPEDSAGRLMTKRLVSVPEFWTVGDTIDYLRNNDSLPSNFYVVYVTDPKFKPVGRVTIGHIMQSKRDTRMADIMSEQVYAVHSDTDQEEVAYTFRKYGLVETPVINEQGRLIGTITVDDVVDVIQEEEEEDFLRAGGLKTQDIQANLSTTVKRRFPWLFINLLTAVLASVVIGVFEETIAQLVALAVLMPIVASMGGNAGTQSVTVAVRAIATRQLHTSNALRAIRKELLIGTLNGLGLSVIMAIGAFIIYQDMKLAVVLAVATIITLMVAGFAGALIPVMLDRLRIDPAIASGIFLTTVTDIVGFFTFLGLASLMLL